MTAQTETLPRFLTASDGLTLMETTMCSVYVNADPIQYEARTRSLRINNVLTTIRLENLFWDVLAEIAGREDKTTNQMIATLHGELSTSREDNPNFTSFLRVCCLRYLSLPRLDEAAQKHALFRTTVVPAMTAMTVASAVTATSTNAAVTPLAAPPGLLRH